MKQSMAGVKMPLVPWKCASQQKRVRGQCTRPSSHNIQSINKSRMLQGWMEIKEKRACDAG